MNDFPEDLFSQLYRRAPNDAERDRLLAVKASLGLSSRDEMWPVIMTLDYYAATTQAARKATVKEIRSVLDEIKAIPSAAGPIAEKEAQRSISDMVDAAADKIAKVAIKKTESRSEAISRQQLVMASVLGAVVACAVAALGALATYLILDAQGVCAEAPGLSSSGDIVCFVDRVG